MKKLLLTFCLLTTLVGLTACDNSSSNSNPKNTNNNLQTFTESEEIADLQNLNDTEKSLEGVGLKIHEEYNSNNGLSTINYSWDKDFYRKFATLHPDSTTKDMIAALENYENVCNSFLKKYSGQFNTKKTDGTVVTQEIIGIPKQEIETKVKLANDTIAKLKTN